MMCTKLFREMLVSFVALLIWTPVWMWTTIIYYLVGDD